MHTHIRTLYMYTCTSTHALICTYVHTHTHTLVCAVEKRTPCGVLEENLDEANVRINKHMILFFFIVAVLVILAIFGLLIFGIIELRKNK